jgi:hypothetical protein
MNKMLAILLATMLSSVAMAENGVNFEFERERYTASPNTMSNTVKVAPYVKLDNGVKLDIQVGASRNDGDNQQLSNTAMIRVEKLWPIGTTGLFLGGRVGVGEKFGTAKDFSFYSTEAKAKYVVTDTIALKTALRYRNAFDTSNNYETVTWRTGAGFNVTKKDEVEVFYFQKRGDSDANGIILEYTHAF